MEGIQPTIPVGMGDGFGGSGIWLFAILALMWGGFGGNRYGNDRIATTDDLNFGRLEGQVRQNENYIQSIGTNLGNGISSLGYEMANKFAATDALIIQENQKTRDMIQQNKIESLQAQVNELKTANLLGNVVRYPTTSTYNAGANPFCNCSGCGYSGNI